MIDSITVNNRKVFYQRHSTEIPWSKCLPKENWLALVIANDLGKTKLIEISNKLIDNDACFICCVGQQGELLHDLIDEEIVFRQVDIEAPYLPSFDIVTTWHDDIANGLWFAIFTACNAPIEIENVVCLDGSENSLEIEIRDLLVRFNDGYIPD